MIIQAYTAGFITKDAAYDAIKKLNAEYKGKGNQ
jgi:hypothetical protein